MATRRKSAHKGRVVSVAGENRRRLRGKAAREAAERDLIVQETPLSAGEAGWAASYDSQVAKLLGVLGSPDPALDIARNRERLERLRVAGVDAPTAAAVLDAGRIRYAGMGIREEIIGGASESPTGSEWQVIVENPPPANRGQILNMAPPGEGYSAGTKIVLGGFYDDQEAAQVARAITKRFGSYTSFGPKNDLRNVAESGTRERVKMFPILMGGPRSRIDWPACPMSIPWAMLAPHERQAERNHGQTLERLAERGGLAPDEALAVLDDRRWRSMPLGEAIAELNHHVALFNATGAAESGSSCSCGGSCSACKTGSGTHTHEAREEHGDVPFLLAVIRENLRARALEMAFVPDVTEVLVETYAWTWDRVKKAFTDASMAGLIDLQPESGHARLTKREKLLCIPGPEGTKLSWVVLRRDGALEERGGGTRKEIVEIDIIEKTDEGTVCRPFTRVVRDRHLYEMCLARAKKIGEIADHRKIYELVKHDMEGRTVESFFVVKIDFRGQLIDYLELARGQQHRVAVDIEDILHGVFNAVMSHDKCDGFAIIHNHPSGHARPSPADKQLTDRVEAARAIAMPSTAMVDHVVIGMGEYYSFRDKKLFKVRG